VTIRAAALFLAAQEVANFHSDDDEDADLPPAGGTVPFAGGSDDEEAEF
jgi:hypothetical protein